MNKKTLFKSLILSMFVVSLSMLAFVPMANANAHSIQNYCSHGSWVYAKVTADVIGGKCYNCVWEAGRGGSGSCVPDGNLYMKVYMQSPNPTTYSTSGNYIRHPSSGSIYGPYTNIACEASSSFYHPSTGLHIINAGIAMLP